MPSKKSLGSGQSRIKDITVINVNMLINIRAGCCSGRYMPLQRQVILTVRDGMRIGPNSHSGMGWRIKCLKGSGGRTFYHPPCCPTIILLICPSPSKYISFAHTIPPLPIIPTFSANYTTQGKMIYTFFVFFQWLHDVLVPFQGNSPLPTRFITPDFVEVMLKYAVSNTLNYEDEGRQLVYSMVRQYTEHADQKTLKKEIANFQTEENWVLRRLRGPFDFRRFEGATLRFPMSPMSTPFQVIQKAIHFVCTKFPS